MRAPGSRVQRSRSRRAFLKRGLTAGAASAGMSLLAGNPVAFAEDEHNHLKRGDVAMLRFAAAAEILESDLWTQYNELGGIQDNEIPGGSGKDATAQRSSNRNVGQEEDGPALAAVPNETPNLGGENGPGAREPRCC
jgi:hypothetical protein